MSDVQACWRRALLVLWAGSLWSLGLWVTPVIFEVSADRNLAGRIAGRLFSIETYLTAAAALLLFAAGGRHRFRGVYAAAAFLLINEWLWRPLRLSLSFILWHGVSTALFVAACMAAGLSVWQDDFR
jgi:hypothetical protein